MARPLNLTSEAIKKAIWGIVVAVKSGELDTKRANCMISGCKGIVYVNQVQAMEQRKDNDVKLRENMEKLNEYIEHGGQIFDEF